MSDARATRLRSLTPIFYARLALAAVVAGSQLLAIRDLETLPSSIYGGDLYYQMGCVRSIRATLDPMATCSTSGALPGYLPAYGVFVAAATFLGLQVQPAMFFMAVIAKVAGVLLIAWGAGRLFGTRAGLLVAALWYLAHTDVILRYTEFAGAVVVPLYFFALVSYRRDPTRRSAVLLGLTIALAGYSHAVLFIGSVFLFLMVALIELFERESRARPGGLVQRVAIVGALSALALGYWWRPIFQYHFQTSPHYTEWNGGPALATLGDQIAYTRTAAIGLFATRTTGEMIGLADPSRAVQAVVAVLWIAGAVVVIRRRRESPHSAVLTVCVATGIYVFHYLVTQNLAGVSFVPEYVRALLWDFARFLLVAAALGAALKSERFGARRGIVVFATLAIALFAGWRAVHNDGLRHGKRELPAMWQDLQRFVERNTDPSDVFLSSNELSFALSALTGRQVLVTRRAQNDAFVDMDVRNKDAALILYGNDPDLRKRLLRRYRVRYLFWSEEWLATEFDLDAEGRVVDYADPLLYFTNPNYDGELERAGVQFVHRTGWVDPAIRGDEIPRFPLTIVMDTNYRGPTAARHPDLDGMLENVWSYRSGDRLSAALFRIRL